MSEPTVKVVYDQTTSLSEGPVYDGARNELVWVDIAGKTINFLDLSTTKNRSIPVNDSVGAAIPCASGKRVVAAIGRTISLVDRETGAVSDLVTVESDKPGNRINDCKCDRKGRLWFGTMARAEQDGISVPPQGAYYSYNGVADQPIVEVLYNEVATLGEGPVYDAARNELVWVDIAGKTINFLDLATKKNRSLPTNDFVGAAIPCASGKRVVAAIGRTISLVDRETGAVTDVASVENDIPDNRINDCKCDRKGRLWFGTMYKDESTDTPVQGSYYSFDGVECKKFVSDIGISNGIAFSIDWTKMYYIDSTPKLVSRFDYKEETGVINNREFFIDLKKGDHGFPDGMTIDTEGKLWIAEFSGACVGRWDPVSGEMLQRVPIPTAHKITSCCFGGPDYSTLYVTSASIAVSPEDLAKYPDSGKIFAITNLGVKGMPPQFFDDSKF